MHESELTERLDERDLLGVSRGPGVYALRVDAPDSEAAAVERWHGTFDVAPENDALERIAAAATVLYVGAASNVYDRLCDHIGGETRQAAFLRVFPPVEVVDVWSHDYPFPQEYNTARRLANDQTRVWTDGELL